MIEHLDSAELEKAQQVYVPNNTRFLYYNVDGFITSILNYKNESMPYLEVPFEKVKDFISGKKDYSRFKIDYFQLPNISIDVDNEVQSFHLYFVPALTDSNVQLKITHTDSSWKFETSLDGKAIINQRNSDYVYKFYVTKNNDMNLLIRIIEISSSDLLNGTQISFESELEKNLSNVSIVVNKIFYSYGICNE